MLSINGKQGNKKKNKQCITIKDVRELGGKYATMTDEQIEAVIENIHQFSKILVKSYLNKRKA